MPLAVAMAPAPTFPHAFRITTLNVPLDVDNKAELLQGELKISARLALGSNPVGSPGDIESEPQLVKAGGAPVTLHLSKRRE
jgi:hypothetical protein